MVPAHQGLDAEACVAPDRHVGLVLQDELFALECAAKLGDEREPAEAEPVVLGPVGRAGHAGAVGLDERHDRPLQQSVGVVAVVGVDRDARRATRVDGNAFQRDRSVERVGQTLCRLEHARLVADVRQHDRELVAADTRHRGRVRHDDRQPPRDLLEQEVAVTVPEGRVDLLEPIDVEDDHRDARRHVDCRLQTVDQQHAVRQPREAVVQRLVASPLLGERAIGDVLDREPDALVGQRERVDRVGGVAGDDVVECHLHARPHHLGERSRQVEVAQSGERLLGPTSDRVAVADAGDL